VDSITRKAWPTGGCCSGGEKESEIKTLLGSHRGRWKDNIKIDLKEQYMREMTRFVWLRVRWQVLVTLWRASITRVKYVGLLSCRKIFNKE